MADSFGKKTHFPQVDFLFQQWEVIWATLPAGALPDFREAIAAFKDFESPQFQSDPRGRDAFVRRFFRWLRLPASQRPRYPTLLLSARGMDCLAYRQCLWLDYVFNTERAMLAVLGLFRTVCRARGQLVIFGPNSDEDFFGWIESKPDNTSRGPFAGWLAEARLGSAPARLRGNESTVIAELQTPEQVAPEALAYGLALESRPLDDTVDARVRYERSEIGKSPTAAALFLSSDALELSIERALERGLLLTTSRRGTHEVIASLATISETLVQEDQANNTSA